MCPRTPLLAQRPPRKRRSLPTPPPERHAPPAAPAPQRDAPASPRYQDAAERLSPAAAGLIREADALLARGEVRGAINRLERAQRISPRSSEVYFKLSQAYVAQNNLGAAEQFTLKGLSLTGSNVRLQRAGWSLLADIRRARGNLAGADQAEARAAAL
ncbi:tetratricopeptide repeat protein [Marinobacter sp. X15-166B]|uniref:tetratricopeptide repeat protein n=1 Tax=Marinobacter sp. X15-166B TaxID=1897620 RepID=UPI001D1720F2|nr:tetratricopeptide repeat protein [Marinobacter sp. X15-166B]